MPRKQPQRYEQPRIPIAKLNQVPGPEASADALIKHHRIVQDILACHQYDDVVAACHWCCDMESGLAYAKPDGARGSSRMFCSGRCASAHAACQVILHGRPKPKSATGIPPTTSKKTASEPKPDPEPEPDEGEDDENADNPPAEAEEVSVEESTETAAPSESPSTWKPKGPRARKPRKAKAKKPERADGKCAKGIHPMDEANRYEYKGTVWCRECRKASRAASKTKRNGS